MPSPLKISVFRPEAFLRDWTDLATPLPVGCSAKVYQTLPRFGANCCATIYGEWVLNERLSIQTFPWIRLFSLELTGRRKTTSTI
jgi:hypothetical protein